MTDNNRKLYWLTVTYDMPVAGTIQILADNEDHARELISGAYAQMKNFTIIDTAELTKENANMIYPQMELPFETQDKEKMN